MAWKRGSGLRHLEQGQELSGLNGYTETERDSSSSGIIRFLSGFLLGNLISDLQGSTEGLRVQFLMVCNGFY